MNWQDGPYDTEPMGEEYHARVANRYIAELWHFDPDSTLGDEGIWRLSLGVLVGGRIKTYSFDHKDMDTEAAKEWAEAQTEALI
jgi:hypothetical protein